MTLRDELIESIARQRAELDVFVRVFRRPGFKTGDPVPFDHEDRAITMLLRLEKDQKELKSLDGLAAVELDANDNRE